MKRPSLVGSGYLVALGVGLCALASAARSISNGTLWTPDRGLQVEWPFALPFVGGLVISGIAYLMALRSATGVLDRKLLGTALFIQVCALPATPHTSSDLLLNLAYGHMASLGLNPFIETPSRLPPRDPFREVDWPEMVTAYGPLTVSVSRAATMTGGLLGAAAIWKLLMFACGVIATSLVYLFSRALPGGESVATFVFFGFNPLFAWEIAGEAHNDGLVVLAGVLFVWLASKEERWLAWFSLAAGLAAKFSMAPLLAFRWLQEFRASRSRAFAQALGALAVLAVCWWPYLDGRPVWAGVSREVYRSDYIVNSLSSFARLLANLGAPRQVESVLLVWTILTHTAVLIVALRLSRHVVSTDGMLRAAFVVTLFYLCFVRARFWPWYATWLLPLALHRQGETARAAIAAFSVLAPLLYLTGAPGALAILLAHGLTLFLYFGRPLRRLPGLGEARLWLLKQLQPAE